MVQIRGQEKGAPGAVPTVVPIELNSDRPLSERLCSPEVNFSLICSVDFSENLYIKSFKPGTKQTSYEMNHDHKTFDSEQKQIWKTEKKSKVQDSHSLF